MKPAFTREELVGYGFAAVGAADTGSELREAHSHRGWMSLASDALIGAEQITGKARQPGDVEIVADAMLEAYVCRSEDL